MRRMVGLLGTIPVLCLAACLACPPAYAETTENPEEPEIPDSTEAEDMPTVRLYYGFTSMSLEKFDSEAADLGYTEVSLGTSSSEEVEGGIIKTEASDLAFALMSVGLGGESEAEAIEPEFWTISANTASGYGYALNQIAVIPYNSMGIAVTRMGGDIDFDPVANPDGNRIKPFHKKLRFGSKANGGLRLRAGSMLEIEGGVDRTIAFRRWLVWKWAGSALLEMITQEMLGEFIESIRERKPKAAPIVHFIFKNGLSYAWYELRRDCMNWPFESPPPLMLDTFKVGVSVVFE